MSEISEIVARASALYLRGILRFETLDGVNVTSVGNDDGVLLELVELISHDEIVLAKIVTEI